MADKLMLYKYIVKNVAWAARQDGRRSCPSRSSRTTARACTCHQSLWKGGEPLFFDETGYAGLSDMARWYIGGLLKHAPAILAFAAPTTNSYKRLVPGYEAPVNLVYSQRNRSASVPHPAVLARARRPSGSSSAAPTRRATRTWPSRRCCMAGLDGIQNQIEPPAPVDKDLYDLPPEELAKVPAGARLARRGARRARGRPRVPARRRRLHPGPHRDLDRLQARATRSTPIRLRPHPYEFYLYYDI